MPTDHAYAVHFPAGGLSGARLHRFRAASLRSLRMSGDPARWRAVGAQRVGRFAARADARKAWRYEGPGAWSTRVGPFRCAWWRLRLRTLP